MALKDYSLMKRKPSKRVLESLCGQPGPDDGLDPRDFFRSERQRRENRKDLQVCRQVFETLNYVLSGESHDDVLRSLLVNSVAPAPDASRLLVTVEPLDRDVEPVVILQKLKQATGRLRTEVARSISRRKVPELTFQIALRDSSSPCQNGGEQ